MFDRQAALRVLKSFGYNSSSVPPYIYESKNNIGICYSFFDSLYGNLERVAIFNNEQEMTDFLKKLDWYKAHGDNFSVTIQLDNYEIFNPAVFYTYDEEKIDYKIMQQLQNNNYLSSKEKVRYVSILQDLLFLYERVRNNHSDTFGQLLIAECDLENLKNAIQVLKSAFKKIKSLKYTKVTPEKVIPVIDERIKYLHNELERISTGNQKQEYKLLFATALSYLKELELDTEDLKTKYRLQELKLNIKILNGIREELSALLSAKRNLFSKKTDLNAAFVEIDKKNITKNIPISEMIAQARKNIEFKYSLLQNLDELDTLEFLQSVDDETDETEIKNLYLKYSNQSYSKKTNQVISKEKVFDELILQYDNLNENIKAALQLYNSPLKVMFNHIFQVKNYQKLTAEEILIRLEAKPGYFQERDYFLNDFSKVIEDINNVSFKHQYFGRISFNSHLEFINSLLPQMKIIKNASQKLTANHDFNVYFAVSPDGIASSILTPMTLNSGAVFRYLNNNETHIVIGTIKKGTELIVIPKTIKVADNETDLIIEDNPVLEIFIDTNNITANKKGKTKIVTKYRSVPKLEDQESLTVVETMNLLFKNTYGIAEIATEKNYEILDI